MRLGKTSIYGIFAVLYVAKSKDCKPVQGREIAETYGIPVEYLLKILQSLVRVGVLRSVRGRTGGFSINRSPHEVTLEAIIDVLEPAADINELLNNSVPGHLRVKSFLRSIYEDTMHKMQRSLKDVSIGQLVELDRS